MNLRKSAPLELKQVGRRASVAVGKATAGARIEPSFLLVGGQRCGTTSLYRALLQHPSIVSATFHKGVNYFDVNYERGPRWYRGHFPLRRPGTTTGPLAFDASGYYMFHPHAPRRIVHDLPDVKIVAMVRDPVERAYSAYQHELMRGFETEQFATALELEDDRVLPELERMLNDESYQSSTHRHQAYRRRGEYAQQLQPFISALGPTHVFVMESERFFEDPQHEYAGLLQFLRLAEVGTTRFDRYNARARSPLDEGLRQELRDHFASHDDALAGLLGRQPRWRL